MGAISKFDYPPSRRRKEAEFFAFQILRLVTSAATKYIIAIKTSPRSTQVERGDLMSTPAIAQIACEANEPAGDRSGSARSSDR